jgi:hypothetical protein
VVVSVVSGSSTFHPDGQVSVGLPSTENATISRSPARIPDGKLMGTDPGVADPVSPPFVAATAIAVEGGRTFTDAVPATEPDCAVTMNGPPAAVAVKRPVPSTLPPPFTAHVTAAAIGIPR